MHLLNISPTVIQMHIIPKMHLMSVMQLMLQLLPPGINTSGTKTHGITATTTQSLVAASAAAESPYFAS